MFSLTLKHFIIGQSIQQLQKWQSAITKFPSMKIDNQLMENFSLTGGEIPVDTDKQGVQTCPR